MRIISLYFCDELTTTFEGITYKFQKNIAREISTALADKLLKTGEFIEIIGDISIQTIAENIPAVQPKPIVPKKKKRCKNCPE